MMTARFRPGPLVLTAHRASPRPRGALHRPREVHDRVTLKRPAQCIRGNLLIIMTWGVSALVAWNPATRAGQITKEFYSSNVDVNAPILAGGRVQTWAGKDTLGESVTIKAGAGPKAPPVMRRYVHATGRTSGPVTFNGGLPIGPTGSTAAVGDTDSAKTTDAPQHVNANLATASEKVDPLALVARIKVRVPNQNVPKQIMIDNVVHGTITTNPAVGVPRDGDKWHSADAAAGVEVEALKTFVGLGNVPIFQVAGRNLVSISDSGGGANGGIIQTGLQDPYFLTLNDLTTGESFRQEFMTQNILVTNGDLTMDDTGIHMLINRSDPNSSVSVDFSQNSWVADPYSYSMQLDASGLTLGGTAPLSGWTVTTTATTISADLAFGPDGMPFDLANVSPDPSLLNPTDTYSVDLGEGGAAYELASVPEPSTLLSTGVGMAVVLGLMARRRERSAS